MQNLLSKLLLPLLVILVLGSCAPIPIPSHQYAYPSIQLKPQSRSGKKMNTVIYDPKRQHYYSVWIGNRAFDIEVFEKNGESLIQIPSEIDMRGIWMDANGKLLVTNAFLGGLEARKFAKNGLPAGQHIILNPNHEPPTKEALATGMSEAWLFLKKQRFYYLNQPGAWAYKANGKPVKPIRFKGMPTSWDAINPTQLLCTGWKGKELGIVDFKQKKVYLFDEEEGIFSASISLPRSAIVPEAYGIGFANGLLWLFDQQKRIWTGYELRVDAFK